MAKIEDLVLTIDQMQYLQELGVEIKDTALCWCVGELSFQDVKVKHQAVVATNSKPQKYGFIKNVIPTLTLQEILAMLPERISVDGFENDFYFSHDHNAIDHFDKMRYWAYKHCTLEGSEIIKKTEFECAYSMLVWCAKQGYLNK